LIHKHSKVLNIKLSILSISIIMNSALLMAETESTYPYADIEALQENASKSDKNNNRITQKKTNSLNASKNNKRSIKVLVGGSSEDGLAKEVTIPVNDE